MEIRSMHLAGRSYGTAQQAPLRVLDDHHTCVDTHL